VAFGVGGGNGRLQAVIRLAQQVDDQLGVVKAVVAETAAIVPKRPVSRQRGHGLLLGFDLGELYRGGAGGGYRPFVLKRPLQFEPYVPNQKLYLDKHYHCP
jgi:hypothetical protein